jgi:hypothetical protein
VWQQVEKETLAPPAARKTTNAPPRAVSMVKGAIRCLPDTTPIAVQGDSKGKRKKTSIQQSPRGGIMAAERLSLDYCRWRS